MPDDRSSTATEQPLDRRPDTASGSRSSTVVAPGALGALRRRRALGAQHQVLGGVLGGDELDHVDAVAERLERRGPQRVGDEIGLAAEQQPVTEDAVLGALRRSAPRARGGSTARRRSPRRRAARRRRSPRRSRCRRRAARRAGRRARRPRSRRSASPRTAPRRSRARSAIPRTVSITPAFASSPTSSTRVPDLAPVRDEREAHVRLAAAGVDDADPVALPDRQRAQQLDVVLHLPPLVARELASPRRADGRRAAGALRAVVHGRGRLPATRGGRARRASVLSSSAARGRRRRARAGGRCARPRAARRAAPARRRARRSRCARRRRA